jgi:DoxX-like protein
MRAKTAAYWTATTLLVFGMLSGGIAELLRRPENVAGMAALGYPVYFMLIIGAWKVLGSVALLVPGLPRLKEWAYAGFFFNMTGAAISHAASADATWHISVTLGFAALVIASWALRPASRTLGTLGMAATRRRATTTASTERLVAA